MRNRRFTLGLVGLGAATVLSGALVLTAADAGNENQPERRPAPPAAASQTPPCSADTAQHWIDAGLVPPCGTNRTDNDQIRTQVRRPASSCILTADTAEHWIRATGHLPCEP